MWKRKKLRGAVEKVVRHYGEPEKAQIEIQEADPLHRELRVENEAEPDGDGKEAPVRKGRRCRRNCRERWKEGTEVKTYKTANIHRICCIWFSGFP
jgi:hypothetical protein